MTELKRISLDAEMLRNPQLNKDELANFRDWVDKQPHLPDIEDEELVLFLHSCNYRLEAAKTTLDNYYTVRTHVPDFFANRDASRPDMRHAISVTGIVPLPSATPEGYKVVVCRLVDMDPTHYDLTDTFKVFLMVTDLWLMSEGTAPGHVIVFDMDGVVFGHIARLSLGAFKKFFFYLQEAMPVRLKGLHFVNVVPFMDMIMAMMKPFMKKELLGMLHLHTESIDSLFQFVPREMFPEDYGGKQVPYKTLHELTLPRLQANRKWFKQEEARRVTESKRPGKARSAGELFGMEGSFKKLDID